MEPRATHLGHCSLLKNSTIAQCILLNFERVDVSSSSCRPAKSFPPNVMSAGNSFEHVFCNATNDVHGYRLPVPISPQDDGCDFPHVSPGGINTFSPTHPVMHSHTRLSKYVNESEPVSLPHLVNYLSHLLAVFCLSSISSVCVCASHACTRNCCIPTHLCHDHLSQLELA